MYNPPRNMFAGNMGYPSTRGAQSNMNVLGRMQYQRYDQYQPRGMQWQQQQSKSFQRQQQNVAKPTPPQPANPPIKSILKKDSPVTPMAVDSEPKQDPKTGLMSETGEENGSGDENTKKGYWNRVKGGKISKKERRGRRNQRLRKILQPKNALMVLNELVGGQKFSVNEKTDLCDDGSTFVASLQIEGIEHLGFGKSKLAAKNKAAEVALKYMILNKLGGPHKLASLNAGNSTQSDGDEMKDESATEEEDISWLHVASFALHKLFTEWTSDGTLPEQLQCDIKMPATPNLKTSTNKPAKQLPENAQAINPVMLLNQMRPRTLYEDVGKEGNPPSIIFTVKINCDGEDFFGKGPNKKVARKNCAYAACQKLFNINYPPEEYPDKI